MGSDGMRSKWSAETLIGGLAGIHNQEGLLLTKVEGDHDLQTEIAVTYLKFRTFIVCHFVFVTSDSILLSPYVLAWSPTRWPDSQDIQKQLEQLEAHEDSEFEKDKPPVEEGEGEELCDLDPYGYDTEIDSPSLTDADADLPSWENVSKQALEAYFNGWTDAQPMESLSPQESVSWHDSKLCFLYGCLVTRK